MEKQEMEALLKREVAGLGDFLNGFRHCATIVLDAFDKKEKEVASAAAKGE